MSSSTISVQLLSSQDAPIVVEANPSPSPSAASGSSPKKLRFTVADDVQVLRELAMHDRPFKYGSKAWREIASKMKGHLENVKERTVRERVIKLVELHQSNQRTSQKQSGTTEDYTEKDALLDGVVQMYEDEMKEKDAASKERKVQEVKADQDRQLGLQIRDDAMETLKDKRTATARTTEPPAKKPRKEEETNKRASQIDAMRDHMVALQDLKRKELETRNRELDVRRQELELQRAQVNALVAIATARRDQ